MPPYARSTNYKPIPGLLMRHSKKPEPKVEVAGLRFFTLLSLVGNLPPTIVAAGVHFYTIVATECLVGVLEKILTLVAILVCCGELNVFVCVCCRFHKNSLRCVTRG